MMLPAPRIIAIDDEVKHLQGLADGLNRYGAGCLQIPFTAAAEVKRCPHARVIFADLHLTEGGAGTDHAQHMAVIGGLIEESIAPSGPYMIVLWTKFPDQAENLRRFLDERLKGVAKPFAVGALDKAVHLDLTTGSIKDPEKLVQAIHDVVAQQPQMAALLSWEDRVLGAAAETVSAIMEVIPPDPDGGPRARALGGLLWRLAVEAVGEGHVDRDRFQAVNEALLPILADRIAFLRSRAGEDEIWEKALAELDPTEGMSHEEAGRLNLLLHMADGQGFTGCDRGSVIPLPATHSGERFEPTFGLTTEAVAKEQFGCKDFAGGDERFKWVLVQVQAACDFAQRRPGPLPFLLGLEMPVASASKGKPDAVWTTPVIELGGSLRLLSVNSRFQVSLHETVVKENTPVYRLREQLLNQLIYQAHGYGARPGIISFRGTAKAKTAEPPTAVKKES